MQGGTSAQKDSRKWSDELVQKSASPERRNRRILIVEDDLELSAVLDGVIASIDPEAEVDWVTSAEQAYFLLEEKSWQEGRPYDLALVDIFLEGETTGLELWRHLQHSLPNVPIVITSAMPVHKFFDALGENTISPPFLAKPFKAGECRQLLEGLLTGYGSKRH